MIHNSKHTHHCKNSHSFDDDDGSARQCPSMCPSCDWSLVARDRTTRATDCTEQWPSWAGLGRCSLVVSISQRCESEVFVEVYREILRVRVRIVCR